MNQSRKSIWQLFSGDLDGTTHSAYKLHWHVEIITAEMVSVCENSSQQNSQKTVFTQIFLLFGLYETFVKIYLIRTEILSVINSRESGFSRFLGARDISGAI
jgi:hypothetical protein